MLNAKQLKTRPAAFQRLTGVSPNEFDTIIKLITPLWNAAEQTRLNTKKRKRAVGAGAQFKLEITARVLLVLIYLRQYCTQEFLGWLLFQLDKSNVCRNIHLTLPVLEQALPSPIRARTLQTEADVEPRADWSTSKRRKIGTLKEFLEAFPELETVIVDATEQERAQPKPAKKQAKGKKAPGRPKKQKKYFSGKSWMHALKTQYAVTPEGVIVHQSATVPAPMSDSMLLRRSRLVTNLPPGTRVVWDTGYVGMEKIYPEFEVAVPIKKPKGGTLTDEQKEFNRQVSKVRIVVENTLCRVKTFRVLKDFFRNPDSSHGQLAGVVSGLVNLRMLNRMAVAAAIVA
jgi:DDE superfamily endonuclease/Helix-turn-helix of DDE superfamily endonuclease